MSNVTLSVIKADVGSIGGHTKPSEPMLEAVRSRVRRASANLLLDGLVTCTGDDIAIIMSHRRGVGAPDIHHFAWDCFLAATEEAKAAGLYGAGQDLLVDAPSGNVRGLVRQSPRSSSFATPEAKIARQRHSSFLPPTSAAQVLMITLSTASSVTRCITVDCC
jgi:fructose 1,6-bisphosphatase